PRPPGSLCGRHVPLLVELGSVLAEVPDVAARVLGVVVERPLLEVAGQVEAVRGHAAGRAPGRGRLRGGGGGGGGRASARAVRTIGDCSIASPSVVVERTVGAGDERRMTACHPVVIFGSS